MVPKLEVKDLSYSYHSMDGETKALSNISFSVSAGEFLAVVGPSGCGKSTLLSLICGLLKASEGSVLIDGKPMETGDSRIGYMLQKDHLFEWRTIFSNACLGLEIQRNLDEEGRERVRRLLETYGLEDFADARPSELSGGMRQRAALIRTLALEPDILLLDEPFSALDYQTRLAVCDDISTIIREQKKTAILVTHDLSEAVSVADRILILTKRPGRVKDTITIRFPDNAGSPLLRRNCPEFSSYFNDVWKVLREGGAS
ncbi:MAG: ABC transporter ATP-binding protein [Lachnospiraceae bacterium]|nr:ABC transporter ATP-binding protein [Lachnospiraceae bacterium]